MLEQTPIPVSDLSNIKAKVLIIAGDEEGIKTEHTLEIYKNTHNAQLCIMPGTTHYAPHQIPSYLMGLQMPFYQNRLSDQILIQ